jgi:peptidoglycan hydrolase CwlO-like protein
MTYQTDLQQALEGRLNEFSSATKKRHDEISLRLGRVVDEANVGTSSAVESAARPILKKIENRQDKVESDVEEIDATIRKFEEQAGQMGAHMNAVTTAVDTRLERVSVDLMTSLDERMAALVARVDEISAAAARQRTDVSNLVGTLVDASEEQTNERIVGLESRLSEEIGQRVADIDVHVGRIGAGLDDAVITLNDRIAAADGRFTEVESEFATIREGLVNVDVEAIDEIKDKVSSALGQAELVRIEMDRFKEGIEATAEKTAMRLTEIETTVQDQSMDVQTAVQLERLEEVERAVLMLDPDIIRSAPAEEAVSIPGPPKTAPLAPPTVNTAANLAPLLVDLSMSLDPSASY